MTRFCSPKKLRTNRNQSLYFLWNTIEIMAFVTIMSTMNDVTAWWPGFVPNCFTNKQEPKQQKSTATIVYTVIQHFHIKYLLLLQHDDPVLLPKIITNKQEPKPLFSLEYHWDYGFCNQHYIVFAICLLQSGRETVGGFCDDVVWNQKNNQKH
jgi:hypothetical protein